MKLTKIQISALADKIYNQVSSKIDAENKALKEDPAQFAKWKKENKEYIEALENAIKYCKEVLKFDDHYYIRNVSNIDVPYKLHSEFKDTLQLKSTPSKQSIQQDIILETIEASDINTIIDKLVEKYSK
jgi:hypothetical protein